MITGKDAKVEKGGLFDFPEGEVRSTRWGHIKLNERIVNPVFETPAAILLGIPVSKAAAQLKAMGMSAVCAALKKIDVNSELKRNLELVKTARKTERDLAYRRIKLLKNLKKLGLSAFDAYTMKNMPVLPPRMRPISLSAQVGAQGDIDTVDINQLYKHVGIANDLVASQDKLSTTADKNTASFSLYSAVKEAYIDGALDNKGAPMNSLLQAAVQPKDAAGHKQGKQGFFQAKLIN